jgi:hypothetical protein
LSRYRLDLFLSLPVPPTASKGLQDLLAKVMVAGDECLKAPAAAADVSAVAMTEVEDKLRSNPGEAQDHCGAGSLFVCQEPVALSGKGSVKSLSVCRIVRKSFKVGVDSPPAVEVDSYIVWL